MCDNFLCEVISNSPKLVSRKIGNNLKIYDLPHKCENWLYTIAGAPDDLVGS